MGGDNLLALTTNTPISRDDLLGLRNGYVATLEKSDHLKRAQASFCANPEKEFNKLFSGEHSSELKQFLKLSEADQIKYLTLASDLIGFSKDTGINKQTQERNLLNLLNIRTPNGELALLSMDRKGSDNSLNQMHAGVFEDPRSNALPELIDRRREIVSNFIADLTRTTDQGVTNFCVPFSILEASYLTEPAEVARQLREMIVKGQIETNKPDGSGGFVKIAASTIGFDETIANGASQSAILIAGSYMLHSGVNPSGMSRAQAETFLELFGGPAVLDALSDTKAAHEIRPEERVALSAPIIAARMNDLDANGKMKPFFVSMQWMMNDKESYVDTSGNALHTYHNLAVINYDKNADSFIALNPWPEKYKIPRQLAEEFGIEKLAGVDGSRGYIKVPKESMEKLMNWIAYNSKDSKDLGLSKDAQYSGKLDETTYFGDFDFIAFKKLVDEAIKKNTSQPN